METRAIRTTQRTWGFSQVEWLESLETWDIVLLIVEIDIYSIYIIIYIYLFINLLSVNETQYDSMCFFECQPQLEPEEPHVSEIVRLRTRGRSTCRSWSRLGGWTSLSESTRAGQAIESPAGSSWIDLNSLYILILFGTWQVKPVAGTSILLG